MTPYALPTGHRNQRGFSLVELIVTISILAILTAMAAPSMVNLIKDARLSSQSDLLVSILNTARMEAIKQRKSITVCPAVNANTDSNCPASGTWANGMLIWDGSAIIQRIQPKTGLTIANSANKTSVAFSATLGGADAASAFTLCVKGRPQQQVDIALSGHIGKKINATTCP